MRVLIEPTVVFPPETEQAINKLKAQFKEAETSASKAGQAGADAMGKAAAPIREQVGLIAGLKKELSPLGTARDNAFDPAEVKRLNKEIDVTANKLNGLESLGKKQSPITSFFGGAADFIKGGLVISAVEGIGSAIAEGASEMAGMVREFEKFQIVVSQTTGLSGQALAQQTADITAVAKTFGKEQSEILTASNTVAKQFGISQEESLALIEKGFLKGADTNGEFLSILSEYPAQFKAAGLNAEQFIASTVNGAQQGIFSDKSADTIKEFGLRIREMAAPTRDALINAFGQPFTDELDKSVKSGELTSAEALQRVSAEINAVNPNAQQTTQLLADVFGSAGEDAGIDYIRSLEGLGGGLDSVRGASAELEAQQMAQLDAQKRIAAATAELSLVTDGAFTSVSTLGNQIKAFALEALVGTIKFLRDLTATLIALPGVISENKVAFGLLLTGLVAMNGQLIITSAQLLIAQARIKGQILLQQGWAAVTNIVTVAQKALNLAMRANPIGLIIMLVTTLVGVFLLLYNKFWQVRAATDGFVAGLKAVGDIIGGFVMDSFRGLAEAIGGIIDVLSGDFVSGFARIGKGITMATTGAVKNAAKGFGNVGAASAKAFNDRYEKELKDGAKSATVNDPAAAVTPTGTTRASTTLTTNTASTRAATVASQKYEEQLKFETKAIEANTDALADSTKELDKQSKDILRKQDHKAQNLNPLQIDLMELLNDTEEMRQAAGERRDDAIDAAKDASKEQLSLLKTQRDERQKELDKAVSTGGNKADITNLKNLLATYDAEVLSIEKQTATARTEVVNAFNRNIQAVEMNSYTKRTAMLKTYITEQREEIKQGRQDLLNLSDELSSALLADSDKIEDQIESVHKAFDRRIEAARAATIASIKEVARLQEELNTGGGSPDVIQVDLDREKVALENNRLQQEKIIRESNQKIAQLNAAAFEKRIKEEQDAADRQLDALQNAIGRLGNIEGLGGIVGETQKTLESLSNVRLKFEKSEAAQRFLVQREAALGEMSEFSQVKIDKIWIQRRDGEQLSEEDNAYLDRYEKVQERLAELDKDSFAKRDEFNKERTQSVIDLTIQSFDLIASTILAITDLQIKEVDRLISAQQNAVTEAERIAETGNSRQLALERERLETLQKEREKFVRRQQALAVLELIANSAVAVAKAAAQGGIAAPITIAATLLALGVGLAQAKAQAQSAATGFKVGGYTGDAPNDRVSGVVHGREFVINAAATERYRPLLESINKGEPVSKTSPPAFTPWGTPDTLKQVRSGGLNYAPAVQQWARTDQQIVQQAVRMDGLERQMSKVHDAVKENTAAIDQKPVADFRYDEKGVRKRMKNFDRIEDKTRKRAS